MLGINDEMEKYIDNMGDWGKENYNWIIKNQTKIKTDIINTIVNNLYS
jgi:hypothetical protein